MEEGFFLHAAAAMVWMLAGEHYSSIGSVWRWLPCLSPLFLCEAVTTTRSSPAPRWHAALPLLSPSHKPVGKLGAAPSSWIGDLRPCLAAPAWWPMATHGASLMAANQEPRCYHGSAASQMIDSGTKDRQWRSNSSGTEKNNGGLAWKEWHLSSFVW